MPESRLPDKGTLTAKEIADDLSLTVGTVQQKLSNQSIPGGTKLFGKWRIDSEIYAEYRENLFKPAVPADPYGFTPRSPRAISAQRAASRRSRKS